jgi:hypothetical protein
MLMHVRLLMVFGLVFVPTATLRSQPIPAFPGPRVDLYGDPLPEGAIARMGSVRFHHPAGGVTAAAFAPDGKTIAVVVVERAKKGSSVRFWETPTGKELSQFEVDDNHVRSVIWTADAKGVLLSSCLPSRPLRRR